MKNIMDYCNVCGFWSNIKSDHANYSISAISLSTND